MILSIEFHLSLFLKGDFSSVDNYNKKALDFASANNVDTPLIRIGNNLNPKDPVAMGLFNQKDLVLALEKAERRIKREKKIKEKLNLSTNNNQ